MLALQVKYPDNFVYMDLDDVIDDINYYKKDPTKLDSKIALSESMIPDTVQWFHQVTGHDDDRRLCDTWSQRRQYPKLPYRVN